MKIPLILIGLVLSLSLAQPSLAAHSGECHLDPDTVTWTKTEQWVWTQTCQGRIANITTSDFKDNKLSAKFLQTILLFEPWTKAITRKGVRIRGARTDEPLDLSNATIKFPLVLVGSTFTDISFQSAHLGKLTLSGSTVDGTLDMDRLTTASSLIMRNMSMSKGIDLRGANIGGQLTLSDSTVGGTVNMDKLKIDSSLFMRGKASFSAVNLTAAQIGGGLHLGSSGSTSVMWSGDAPYIKLTNARVGEIWDMPEAWPGKVTLHGFSYSGFGLEKKDMSGRDADWLIAWLAKSRPFSPQPYEQLAKVLRVHGHAEEANEVLYAKFEQQREISSGLAGFLLTLRKVVVGYGYHPYWALGWLGGIIALGTLFAQASDHKNLPNVLESLEYSADMVVPIIKLRAKHSDIDHTNPKIRWYFYLHQLMGYFLAYYIITAMTTT